MLAPLSMSGITGGLVPPCDDQRELAGQSNPADRAERGVAVERTDECDDWNTDRCTSCVEPCTEFVRRRNASIWATAGIDSGVEVVGERAFCR